MVQRSISEPTLHREGDVLHLEIFLIYFCSVGGFVDVLVNCPFYVKFRTEI